MHSIAVSSGMVMGGWRVIGKRARRRGRKRSRGARGVAVYHRLHAMRARTAGERAFHRACSDALRGMTT
ncbi:MAG: hypothetical protein VYC34_11390 [Planctomycetota bacterium]|nr:hypothetical protein [Planctomycetota bacterium]